MSKEPRQFVDEDRPIMDEWCALMEGAGDLDIDDMKREAKKLIDKEPDFLDPYTLLFEVLQEEGDYVGADRILDEAYKRALALIADEKGNWPDLLEWGFLQNRHIIRALVNKAIWLWDEGKNSDALDILRKLLKANIGDNIGARFYILGIRMDMTFEDFQDRFDKGGYYDTDLMDWFGENMGRFPDEFDWWQSALE